MPVPKRKVRCRIMTLEEAIRPPKDYDMRRDGMTQSLLGKAVCPVKLLLAANRWKSRSKLNTTFFGSVCHHCMETAYGRQSPPSGQGEIDSWIKGYIKKNEEEVGHRMETEVQTEIATARALMSGYFDFYKKDFATKRFQRVEKTWRVWFGQYTLLCKIDGEFLSNRKPWLMEHKTKGRIEEEKLQMKLSFDFQNLYYATIYHTETGKESVGTLYNVLRNPKSKPKAGESLLEFTDRLRGEIKKNSAHYFKRWEVAYTTADHARFRKELPYKLSYAESILTGKIYPCRNEFACEMYFGCEYLSACATGSMNGFYQAPKLFTELEDE